MFNYKTVLKLLTFTFLIATALLLSSCSRGGKNAEIFVVSEKSFEKYVKLDDDGQIKKISLKKLRKADEEVLITGEKYYAVVYVDNIRFKSGTFNFGTSVTSLNEDIYAGRKRGSNVMIDTSRKYGYFAVSKTKCTDHYFAVGFEFDNFRETDAGKGKLSIKFNISSDHFFVSATKERSASKELRYKKQIDTASNISFITRDEYLSGNIDSKPSNNNNSVNAVVDEKMYAVIDFTFSNYKDIEEFDAASVSIYATDAKDNNVMLYIEELPTADYKLAEGALNANITIKDGGKDGKRYRFIVSFTPKSAGQINFKAFVSSNDISFLNGKNAYSNISVVTSR